MNNHIVLFDTVLNFTIEANIEDINQIIYNVYWNGVDIGHTYNFYDDALEYCYFNFDHHDNWKLENVNGVYVVINPDCDFYANFQTCEFKSKSMPDFSFVGMDTMTISDMALVCRTIQNYKGMWYYTMFDDYDNPYLGKRASTVYIYGLDSTFRNELRASKMMDAIYSLHMKTNDGNIQLTVDKFNHKSSATSLIDLIVDDIDKILN